MSNASKAAPVARPDVYSCVIMRAFAALGHDESSPIIMAIKAYRDGYLSENPFGRKMIEDYYASTTGFVERFEKSASQRQFSEEVYFSLSRACAQIEASKEAQAFETLRDLTQLFREL